MKTEYSRTSGASAKVKKPAWWQVYAMLPVLAAGFLLEMRLPLTNTEHILAQLGILFLIYGFLQAWLKANRRALMGLDEEHGEWRIRVYEIPPAETAHAARSAHRQRPLIQVPETEVKGVLSTTFEMDEEGSLPVGSEMFYSEEMFNTKETKDTKV